MKFLSFSPVSLLPQSLPSRERGLKFTNMSLAVWAEQVAPFAGAWIEILDNGRVLKADFVAPFAGAWIEMLFSPYRQTHICESLPSRERGLKSSGITINAVDVIVAPFAGAWIEIHLPHYRLTAWHVAPFAGAWIEIPHTALFICA